jgi:dTDP-glucose 4,6-dehydratase
MKLLVTGGAGFIGSNFILYWLETHAGDEIINLDKLTYAGNLENLKSVEKNPRYSFVQGDICDPSVVSRVLSGVDTVVHFAAESHVDRSILAPSAFVQTNVVGTHVLLEQSLKSGVTRFHHVSTDEVFGSLDIGGKKKFDEQTPYDPRSPYSASKAGSDHLVRAYYHTFGLPVTISNCSNNYGPYQFPEKLIPLVITNILEGKKVPLYGDGLNIRDWLYVWDHCKALDKILDKGKIGETYCIGGLAQDINNSTVVHKIIEYMGAREDCIENVKDRPGHDRRYAIDWSRIHNELGWAPEHDFDTWLKNTVDWYKSHEEWWKRIKNGAYKTYYQSQYGGNS